MLQSCIADLEKATGDLGTAIVKNLAESGFQVTALVRGQAYDGFPGIRSATVDYDNIATLEAALEGQHAVVSALSRAAILSQIAVFNAAIAKGVRRVIPSEFGANLQNQNARRLPNYQTKVQVEEYLEARAVKREITYTYIYTNSLMDWSVRAGIILDLRARNITLYNGGDNPVSMSTIDTAANAVVAVLSAPTETKNRAVYVHGTVMSQRELLELAKRAIPVVHWTEEVVDLQKLEEETLQQNIMQVANMTMFHVGAMKAGFAKDYGNRFGESDNELLRIPALLESDVKQLLQALYAEVNR